MRLRKARSDGIQRIYFHVFLPLDSIWMERPGVSGSLREPFANLSMSEGVSVGMRVIVRHPGRPLPR